MSHKEIFEKSLQANRKLAISLSKEQLKEIMSVFDNYYQCKDVLTDNFSLSQLISFGYYARKHPDTVMRENYLNWIDDVKSGKIAKATLD